VAGSHFLEPGCSVKRRDCSRDPPERGRVTERPIRPEDLAVDESTIVLSAAGGRGTSSGLFRELFANVQRLFLDEEGGATPVSVPGGHAAVRDVSGDELEEDTLDEEVHVQSVPSLESARGQSRNPTARCCMAGSQ